MSYITFKDVTKVYGSGESEVRALDGVSFSIEEGELTVLLGSSGAGKTTLLNMLGGMDSVTSGTITFAGHAVSGMNARQLADYRRKDVGFVFQFYNLIPNLTALENVEIAAQLVKDPIPAEEALSMVGLSERMNNFPAQLSGGEQQRVAIARALINKPEILLADEPTGNLDSRNSMEIMHLLEDINSRGTTVIVVTHSHEIVRDMKKRVIVLDRGVVAQDAAELNEVWH